MLDNLRKALLVLTARASQKENLKTARTVSVLAAKLLKNPLKIRENLEGMAEIMNLHEAEVSTWVPAETLQQGLGGPFDTLDLRHWLVLAERAGVGYVPAHEVLSLDEHELAFLSGPVDIPDTPATRKVQKDKHLLEEYVEGYEPENEPSLNPDELYERLYAAMDDVPEGWMVRYARCGSLELKTLAGAGSAGPQVPEVKFGPDLEVGPGWVRTGNRRRIHVSDNRTVEAAAQGPGGKAAFLARPWVEADRYYVGEDPHRHGTAFAGKGIWPAEWRAFVEGGKVVGVANYYGWCGEVSEENARIAMEVREKAQAIVDEAMAQSAWPRFMDVEFMRANTNKRILENEAIQSSLEKLGRETVSCTLDFLESKDGLVLLEGGPPVTPFGGGHPCAFAGCGGRPTMGNGFDISGVAFTLMPHVILADPSTWDDGDRSNCVLSWDEVEALAYSPRPR